MTQNKLAFDKVEFKFAKDTLQCKNLQIVDNEVEIPEQEVIKYFEEDKKATLLKIKREEKARKVREAEKNKEQDRIFAEKEKKFIDDENRID